MMSIRRFIQQLPVINNAVANKSELLSNAVNKQLFIPCCYTSKWLKYNEKIYPIQAPEDPRRLAFVCHERKNIKYSPDKMWYIASFVRGMTVDEAVKQLSFVTKKGAAIAKNVILEAQRKAVEEHNVEFKSNLWVAESFASKGIAVKGIRKHARGRIGHVRYRYCNYYVRLEEGTPPPRDYYKRGEKTPEEMLNAYMDRMRMRKIPNSL